VEDSAGKSGLKGSSHSEADCSSRRGGVPDESFLLTKE
jgi:hypothetical protein